MKFNREIHHRRSSRLPGYDYSQAGMYFVTICTNQKECLFGEIVDGEMRLNECGKIIHNEWLRTAELRPNIELEEYVVMPNHFHGIVSIVTNAIGRGVLQYAPTFKSPSQTIGAMIRGFKSASTLQINKLRNMPSVPVWQRNYHEHIVRDEKSLNQIREYIVNNPAQWEMDNENPNFATVGAYCNTPLQGNDPFNRELRNEK